MDTDDLKLRRWGTVGGDYLGPAFHMRFKPGHVLYGSRRTYLRKVALADFEGVCANTTFVVEVKDPQALLPELLPYLMSTARFHKHSVSKSKGSVNPYVNFSDIAAYEITLPPRTEQPNLAKGLTAVRKALDAYRLLSQSAIEMGRALTAEWERSSDATAVRTEDLVLEPPKNGLSPPESSTGSFSSVSISSVRHGRFDPTGNEKTVLVEHRKAAPFAVRAGDSFVIRGNGNRYLTGIIGLADESYDRVIYPDLLIRIRFDYEQVLPEFAVAQWNLPLVHRRLIARAKSSNGIWKVNGQDIRNHSLKVPPLPTQRSLLEIWANASAGADMTAPRLEILTRMWRRLLIELDGGNA